VWQEAPLTEFERYFRLADESGAGVRCDDKGLFIGETSLLERARGPSGLVEWRPRSLFDLNRDLGKCYGLPVDFGSKIEGLAAVARALDRGDLVHVQIAALLLQIPDPPGLAKTPQTTSEITELARQLQASGLLKADWDPAKHPRWPAKSPDGVGGQFAPKDDITGSAEPAGPSAPIVQAQIAIPAPFDVPIPGEIPLPSEIVPPLVTPNISPLYIPKNPYPSRPECVREWADAYRYCQKLSDRGLLRVGDYRGMGKTLSDCIMGQVSESCGGNATSA
jgi:hypothetical protein